MSEKKYVTGEIQEQYKDWKPTDKIFITAPTGSGKTFFILNEMLNYLLEKEPGKNILYLVNRKILKEQLLQDLNKYAFDIQREKNSVAEFVKSKISLMTYQEIETVLVNSNPKQVFEKMQWMQRNYQIVVYDECHYFYADSNFNTYTELVYDFLSHCFQGHIQIFMSATMDKIKNIFMNHKPIYYKENPNYPNWDTEKIILAPQIDSKNIEYCIDKNYSYVRVKLFEDIDEVEGVIRDSVCNKKEKWLIFVDSKSYGKNLEEILGKKNEKYPDNVIESHEIVYIDTDYEYDEEANASINQLTREKLIKRKVVITTAVMDNGISFHDEDLRNIVIMADTEEEFIQMLGRKRDDEEDVNLYICKRDLKYFKRRLQMVDTKIKTYEKYGCILDSMYTKYKLQNVGYYKETVWVPVYIGPFSSYRIFSEFGVEIDISAHQKTLVRIMNSEYLYQNMKCFLYSYQGALACNKIAVRRLYDLQDFYNEMIEGMEDNEFYFAERQMQWLGKDTEQMEYVVAISKEESDKYHSSKIEAVLEDYSDRELTSEENKNMKKEFIEDMKYYLNIQNGFSEKDIRDLPKTDRTITEEPFNKLMKVVKLPYKMSKPSGRTFKIERIDVEKCK